MYVLWLALLSAAVLCRARSWVEKMNPVHAFILIFVMLEVLCLLLAEATFRVTTIFGAATVISDSHNMFLFRTFAISSIVIALAMRYLYIASEWRRSIVLEAQARISALQALIRPHFLFNSMNTIASLTRSDPARAEEAVEDLADLLRANLGGPKNHTTLKEELEVAAIYQRIEKLRLGDRLKVRWDIENLPMRALIPSLTIQPLLENAIYHGIELLPEGGEVVVDGSRIGEQLHIKITNPVCSDSAGKKSANKMALTNIRQRFELAYGKQATVNIDEKDDLFSVQIIFPYAENLP
jgi:two-component system sensor histidine kinase AlgZ